MLQQTLWSFRYSLEGALKRILYLSHSPLAVEDLEAVLAKGDLFHEQKSRESLRVRINKALNAPHGAFSFVESGWTLRQTECDALHDEIFALVSQNRRPIKQGEILRILQQRTQRSKGELMSRVDLESDWRFARLEEGDWVLTEWNLESLHEPVDISKEEIVVTQQSDLIKLITTEMEEYVSQLQQRTVEIPQEVVEKFNREDLKAIELLMEEKKQIAGFLDDLQQLLDKWCQRKELINA
ncbi:hypothetical protein [Effusibacillus lacus]|uniref:Uncharacterized protein n=1 Tax=Effusibacillus lacus TaxID=1348429 RepID=A0A292YDU5_9BACL|nr:hypothetical protein [Effusibacillus lacus]TCS73202.1 hypothetical protein EDD64_11981 [Effusibacillus lacus]GAX90602.1 hypothetical protein EFBL_2230 [Effusibacillus lacus]